MTLSLSNPRAKKRWVLLGALVFTLSVAVAALTFAVHDTGVFQMDGNAQTSLNSTPSALHDWDEICKANPLTCTFAPTYPQPAGTSGATVSSFSADGVNASIFTTGGSKDPEDITRWRFKDGSVPDKDNLQNAFAARYSVAPSTECPVAAGATTCDLLFFGSDRFDNSGDAQQGFWFFQGKVVLNPATGRFEDGAGNLATHTNGDLLIVSNFSNGGDISTINVYKWLNGGLVFVAGGDQQKCSAALGGPDPFCGIVNPTNGTVAPWNFLDKSGNNSYLQGELFEAGLNLSHPTINLAGECFSSFLAETRSSTSTTATLKDFVLGQFAVCGASITINPPTFTNEVGDTHVLTVHVTKTVGGSTVGAEGIFPTVTLTATNGAVIADKVDNCAITGTDTNGDCTVTFTSNSAGRVTGHAAADVLISGTNFHVETDATGANSGDAVKVFVDAKIAIAANDVNAVGDPHTFTVTVQQDDGLSAAQGGDGVAGFTPATVGNVDVLLTGSNGATAVLNGASSSCDDAQPSGDNLDASGQCTVVFTSNSAGQITGDATVNLTLGGLAITRNTDGVAPNSADAVKRFVDAWITIGPDATNDVGDPHTFTVTVNQDDGLSAAQGGDGVTGFTPALVGNVDVTLTDTLGAVSVLNGASSTCDNNQPTGDNLDGSGQCTVVFTSNSAGTVTGHATVALTVGGVNLTRQTNGVAPNSADAVKTFVAGSIAWTKVDNAGVKQGGATFELCKTHSYNLVTDTFDDLIPDQCVSVVDGTAPDTDTDAGEFLVVNLTLGRYTVRETAAPAGFLPDPDTVTVELTPGASNVTISTAFVNMRPVLKITGFGYTNAATGTPTSGVVSGTVVYTVNLRNYGNGAAELTESSLLVSNTATCTGGNTLALTGTIAANSNSGPHTLTCTYTNLADGALIRATLTVKTTTNGTVREASGSPATIIYTVQAD